MSPSAIQIYWFTATHGLATTVYDFNVLLYRLNPFIGNHFKRTFMPSMLRPHTMASANAPPPQPPGGSMLMMLGVMLLMTVLLINPEIRLFLGETADPVLGPLLPEESYFVFTVLILGSFSMTLNTVLRNFFTDPLAQAHIGHRNGQVRKMLNDARISRDTILQEKATTLQQQMMPEQLKVQMGAMKPMVFTIVFIMAIFAWLTTTVENFRVDYVSLPWASEWNLLDDKFLFFPAWICAYICMSAPLGRIIDRHIKLFRYRKHPLVEAGKTIKEPLLHLVATSTTTESSDARRRRERSQRSNPTKNRSTAKEESTARSSSNRRSRSSECPECGMDKITKLGPRTKRCDVCRHEWV